MMQKIFIFLLLLVSTEVIAQVTDLPLIYASGGKGKNYQWVKPSKQEMEAGWILGDCSAGFYNIETESILRASSVLAPQGSVIYATQNLFDDNPATAWVEGEKDYGIGTYLEAENCLLYENICILNGYQKSPKSFIENSRVKLLKLSLNGKDVCMIQLKDEMGIQAFSIGAIKNRITEESLMKSVRFTILDVYPGTKFKDVAISEMFNSGCCLSSASELTLHDQSKKSFDALIPNDIITLLDANRKLVPAKVLSVGNIVHESMIEIVTENGHHLALTRSHMVSVESIEHKRPAGSLSVGQNLLMLNENGNLKEEKIISIVQLQSPQKTSYFRGLELLTSDFQWPLSLIVDQFITTDEYLDQLNKQHVK